MDEALVDPDLVEEGPVDDVPDPVDDAPSLDPERVEQEQECAEQEQECAEQESECAEQEPECAEQEPECAEQEEECAEQSCAAQEEIDEDSMVDSQADAMPATHAQAPPQVPHVMIPPHAGLLPFGPHMGIPAVAVHPAYASPQWLRPIFPPRWTRSEDEMIKALVARFGEKSWTHIAAQLPFNRTGKQTRERWHNHLAPHISKEAWTEEEDEIIVKAQAQFGNRWTEVSKLLKGRSDNAVKNRWHSKLAKRPGVMARMSTMERNRAMERMGVSERNRTLARLGLAALQAEDAAHRAEEQPPTPQSATPQSAPPQSATSQSAPESATPQSALPKPATPNSATTSNGAHYPGPPIRMRQRPVIGAFPMLIALPPPTGQAFASRTFPLMRERPLIKMSDTTEQSQDGGKAAHENGDSDALKASDDPDEASGDEQAEGAHVAGSSSPIEDPDDSMHEDDEDYKPAREPAREPNLKPTREPTLRPTREPSLNEPASNIEPREEETKHTLAGSDSNSDTPRKRRRTTDWSEQEIHALVWGLSRFGRRFSQISRYCLPNRRPKAIEAFADSDEVQEAMRKREEDQGP